MRVTGVLVGLVALSAAGTAAHAEAPAGLEAAGPVEEDGPRNAVSLLTGLGAPLGFLGLEGARHLGKRFELAAGFGFGLGATTTEANPTLGGTLQWAVMPRLRLGGDRHALTLGAGLSGGNYGGHMGVVDWVGQPPPPIAYVVWGNAEAGYETWRGHLAFRAFIGMARGCPVRGPCNDKTPAQDPLTLPYTGLGFGAAF